MIIKDIPGFDGPLQLSPQVFIDKRGHTFERYNQHRFSNAAFEGDHGGLAYEYVQDNVCFSYRGTLRGLHYQDHPGQAKILSVVTGRIFDVILDMRTGSSTFGMYYAQHLARDGGSLFIPRGFAHGFFALQDAEVHYKVSAHYSPENEKSIYPFDPELSIPWPTDKVAPVVISERDERAPRFRDVAPWPPG